jgi:hypothetical protein
MRYPGGLIANSPVTAAYPSGVWTQAQTQPYAAQNVWMRDQFWPNTTLLLQGNGTNGAQNNTFLDSSANNFTITRNGNTTQGSFTPYEANGYWSNFFDGTGDFLKVDSGNVAQFGTGDFTMEAWVFLISHDGDQSTIIAGGINFSIYTQPNLNIDTNGTVNLNGSQSTSNALSLNTWTHVAVSRNSGTSRIFINGVQGSSASNTQNYNGVGAMIGMRTNGSSDFGTIHGYISNARVIIGTGLYSSNFTPSAAPLTAVSGTSLLTCQSNRFIDNSTNAFAITRNGDTSVQAFQPFPGATTWSGSVLGGSGYFDGTGDYLTAPDNAALNFGTGNFCIECFFYPTTISGTQGIAAKYAGGDGNRGFNFEMSSGVISCYVYSGGGSTFDTIAGGTAIANAWNHIVLCRSGTTLSAFLNGVRTGTSSNSYNITSVVPVAVGANVSTTGASPFFGYIASTRIVKGSTPYDPTSSTLTVPTAPVTAITNTSLLLNFTNAGIFDSAMMNNLETVGNAQVSTSVVKYGTGSMAFDGSGDWLAGPPTPQTDLGSGDFTIEAWLYRTASGAASDSGMVSRGAPSTLNGFVFAYTSANVLTFNFNYSGAIVTGVTVIPANTWTHVAVSRNGNTFRLFVNGVVDATATSTNSQTTNASDVFYVGRAGYDSGRIVTGYLDDVRLTKGAARYIGNFTPPVARMPQQ